MQYQRGFKQDCEQIAAEVRSEMQLRLDQPIDMPALAHLLAIPVIGLDQFVGQCGGEGEREVEEIYAKVSAFTVFDRYCRTIIYNDRHSMPRHRSNLAHEISHALLRHPARDTGLSAGEEELNEKEAHWLGGVLMLTRPQAIHVARTGISVPVAMHHFEISQEMLRFRMNVTGAARLA